MEGMGASQLGGGERGLWAWAYMHMTYMHGHGRHIVPLALGVGVARDSKSYAQV